MSSRINQAVKKEIEAYKKKLSQSKLEFQSLILFGSQAKGKAGKASDIDLCVVSDSFGKNRFEERLRLLRMTDRETINIEPHPYHPADLDNRWDPLAVEIKKYGVFV